MKTAIFYSARALDHYGQLREQELVKKGNWIVDAIIIDAEVGQDHRLIYELPPGVPVGPVKLVIQPVEAPPAHTGHGLTREEARQRLLAAGKLLTQSLVPEGFVRSDEAEDRRLSALFGQGPSLAELIDQDRGPRE